MAKLRTALIGYGLAGEEFHGPLLERANGIEVATVVTGDPERARRARAAHPDAQVLERAELVWERAADHDLVVVATPNDSHVPLARKAIDHGLPVVVDKPLAVTAADAGALVEHAERAGVLLTVFHNRRYDAEQRALRALLADGRLGRLLRVEARLEQWRGDAARTPWRRSQDPSAGGGILLDLGSHLVDQAIALLGPVHAVYAEIDRRDGGVPDDVFLALRHRTGVRSHLWAADRVAPGPRLRAVGTDAAYVAHEPDPQEAALSAGRPPHSAAPDHWGRLLTAPGDVGEAVACPPGGWESFYPAVAAAVRGEADPPVAPRDALAVMLVLEAARESAERGQVVELGGAPATRRLLP
ncbi:Gfo/Idh/MocA family protein [Conexibacter arvalis]|uniref:Putative dehydrogenase n=1 Tax=Conexibacter arvalis TaxID=912552 RepID=A0A840IIS1_9ACTN|nr:Gfo/Idh/MocA family oxidoreductase [Conexibacter arvalis]MBB4664121.1 putative dehydrogenase [Conexibacter arvalis]